ncbi:holo-[acyl-carrier protein] synthase [Balnearium lithotrophicum]|uniref:Holo-[acyl-carrier-protein] synthase n=1 Tax=Balnearium lithotrophicum TaxID=223788 RepID=A0A521E4M6_9BACT|nr:holo-ACP synthase [Balnearium lithotrophicum]SMO78914.1 holo-[acyl-carrier protein] synthase [Balnearium lithotrophicum]
MIVGIGIDIVSVKRIKDTYERFGDRFIKKVFPEGIDYCFKKRKGELHGCIAARFALKEATIKALSQVGIQVGFKDVSVLGGGRRIKLKLRKEIEGKELLFSISHEREFAVAVVNVVKREFHP